MKKDVQEVKVNWYLKDVQHELQAQGFYAKYQECTKVKIEA